MTRLSQPILAASAAVALGLLPAAASAQGLAADHFREQDVRAHIGYLASDQLEGRESGEHGGYLGEMYVEAHFRRLGLEPLPGQTALRLPFTLKNFPNKTFYNVVAVLPGSDPALRDKYLAIGGHMDHAGIGGPGAMGTPGEIHNGADDNASGTAGVLELAEWYAAHPLRHSLILMGFTAEERGLLGSQYLVDEKVVPVDAILAMINLDMIGRSSGYCFIGGLGTAEEFHPLLDPLFDAVEDYSLELNDFGEAPSDNSSFYHGGVPALFFFTNIHDDYHLPGDDAEKIDYAGHVWILNLVREVVDTLDQAPHLTFRECDGQGMPADFMQRMQHHFTVISERRNNRGSLGLSMEEAIGGMRITVVKPGSAAEATGIAADDLLKTVNGREIHTAKDVRRALGGAIQGAAVTVVIERAGLTITLQAILK
jgi:hypothetical protein